jgi:hypothetical protein
MFLCVLTYFINFSGDYFESFNMISKLISNQIFFIYFYNLIKCNRKPAIYYYSGIFKINIIIFLLNIFLGLLGFGYYTYNSAKIGIKGFLYAGNEVSVIFFCLYYYLLTKINKKSGKIFIVYFFVLIIALLIASKTCVLSCILISAIDYYIRATRKKRFYIKLLWPFIVLILIGLGLIFIPQTQFYKNVEYRIDRGLAGGGNVLSAIMSGRIDYLMKGYEIWKADKSLTVLLFGLGSLPKNVEIDNFDVFFMYGVIFTILMTAFYVCLIFMSVKKKNHKLFSFNIIYLFISFTAGHVWLSVSAGLFYAYINAHELKNA